jgi:hypothetical protein
MAWTDPSTAENQPGSGKWRDAETRSLPAWPALGQPGWAETQEQDGPVRGRSAEISIGKTSTFSIAGGKAAKLEVFTLTLGGETIELLPLKTWIQLDRYKWTIRGKLPAEPPGLEIALDHIKMAGETVGFNDPQGPEKLGRLFNDWLFFERETLELARKKAHPQPMWTAPNPSAQAPPPPLRFRVEVDKRGQVHVHCVQGKDTLASIGLSVAGFSSLFRQGLMRKPRTLVTGALHDWVEVDGVLYSFEKGGNDAAGLEQALNARYVPVSSSGPAKEVVIFVNAASSTGFDIQFPVMVGGVPDRHRHHLNEESLELLQDPEHCGLLNREVIIRLTPPSLVFKQKTPDGGEQHFPWRQENVVSFTDEEGHQTTIPLTQPLNLMQLSAAELTAVFNHPAINRHTQAVSPSFLASEPQPKPVVPDPVTHPQPLDLSPTPPCGHEAIPGIHKPGARRSEPDPAAPAAATEPSHKPVESSRPLPNLWLKGILYQPMLEHKWLACLTYSRMAERFGNSTEGKFGPGACWFISLGALEDISAPLFRGIFLTEKGSLGFLNEGHMARFCSGVAFVGTQSSAFEGIQIDLVAVGLRSPECVVFIVSDDYLAKFAVPETTMTEVLNGLQEHGAILMSVAETLASLEPVEIVWIVPQNQPDPKDPEALELTRLPS